LIASREFHDSPGDIAAAEDSRFDLQAPREAKIRVNRSDSCRE
jgi:hypothetical protein